MPLYVLTHCAFVTSANTVQAVAHAFSYGYVDATSSCFNLCEANVTVMTEAIGFVLAAATAHSLEHKCTGMCSPQELINILVESGLHCWLALLTFVFGD